MLSKLFQRIDEGRKEQYMAMLPPAAAKLQTTGNSTWASKWQEYVNWASTTLKKDDRIVWFLRIAKFQMVSYVDDYMKQDENTKEIHDVVKKELAKFNSLYSPSLIGAIKRMSIVTLESQLEHYLSLKIPGIEKIVWNKQTPQELVDEMAAIEKEWKQKQKRTIKHTELSGNEKVLIDFGNGWVWMDLGTQSCSIEGRAMGHCGNAGNPHVTDTVLSLRQKTAEGYIPHCTFILDKETGALGEMKGYGNEKPAQKYHHYILKLLELPIVKSIKGGGYLPGSNFSVADLTDQEQEELMKKKPELGGFLMRFNKFGMSSALIQQVYDAVSEINGFSRPQFARSLPEDRFVILELEAKDDFDHSFDYYYKIISGDGDLFDFIQVYNNNIADFIDNLSEKEQEEINEYFEAKYADEIEENGGSYTVNYLTDVLNHNDDPVYQTLHDAVWQGYYSGTELEIRKAIEKYLEEPGTSSKITIGKAYGWIQTQRSHNKNNDIDSWGTEFSITPELMCALLDSQHLYEFNDWREFVDSEFDMQSFEKAAVPSYGFNDYDKATALEYYRDNGSIPSSTEKEKK